jgi:DNA (cytosine-5)-methyltransferase 1
MYKPNYRWNLTDLELVEKNSLKVFSCFACGGGSTMGYKLAGMSVIGANEIDPEMAWHYKENHKPKHYYLEDIRKFRLMEDLPKELYDLDILDGSPPCSSFSMAGSREKGWGKKKQFREGQVEQVLDDLFFDFIELARKLQPKVVVAENVKGMLQGNAKGYVKQIIGLFGVAGYDVQLFLLNAASMGVPQKRERVFFICSRKDLKKPKLKIGFNSKAVSFKDIITPGKAVKSLSDNFRDVWEHRKYGDRDFSCTMARYKNRPNSYFSHNYIYETNVCNTVTANDNNVLFDEPRYLNNTELKLIGSYPQDYVFKTEKTPGYLIGMSVPPLMTYGVANEIKKQWFNNGNA